jgi:hypothetical protein
LAKKMLGVKATQKVVISGPGESYIDLPLAK